MKIKAFFNLVLWTAIAATMGGCGGGGSQGTALTTPTSPENFVAIEVPALVTLTVSCDQASCGNDAVEDPRTHAALQQHIHCEINGNLSPLTPAVLEGWPVVQTEVQAETLRVTFWIASNPCLEMVVAGKLSSNALPRLLIASQSSPSSFGTAAAGDPGDDDVGALP